MKQEVESLETRDDFQNKWFEEERNNLKGMRKINHIVKTINLTEEN